MQHVSFHIPRCRRNKHRLHDYKSQHTSVFTVLTYGWDENLVYLNLSASELCAIQKYS